jgi:hypothetical protein
MNKNLLKKYAKKIPFLSIAPNDIIEYLKIRPEVFDNKKFHELIIGWIIVQFLNMPQCRSALIGLPAKEELIQRLSSTPISLDFMLSNYNNLTKDSETDIYIYIKEQNIYTKWQICRYTFKEGKSPKRSLADLIAKKCNMYQLDSELNLAVSIEKTPKITKRELKNMITNTRIPFGTILLIIKASEERGHFTCIQLYPKLVMSKKIKIPLLV